MYFLQTMGGAIFVSAAQNLFANELVSNLSQSVPSLDPGVILQAGATQLQQVVDKQDLPSVISAYNSAIKRAFLLATIMAGLTLLGPLVVEWRNIKTKKPEPKSSLDNTLDRSRHNQDSQTKDSPHLQPEDH